MDKRHERMEMQATNEIRNTSRKMEFKSQNKLKSSQQIETQKTKHNKMGRRKKETDAAEGRYREHEQTLWQNQKC